MKLQNTDRFRLIEISNMNNVKDNEEFFENIDDVIEQISIYAFQI